MSATELKDKIKDLRQQAGLTMRQLADAVNVSEATISRWESGNIPNMRRDKIYALAKALNTTPAYLMGWDQEKSSSSDDSENQVNGALFRLNKELEPYNLTDDDTDFLLTVFKAHKERNK